MTEVERLLGEILNAEMAKSKELQRRTNDVTEDELKNIVREIIYLDDEIRWRHAKVLQLAGNVPD